MKKVISLLLVLVLTMSLIVGCSSNDVASNTENEGNSNETKEEETSTSDELVTLTMAVKDLSPNNEAHQAYIKRIEDGLAAQGVNVKIDVAEMGDGSYSENLGLKLLNGDIPDIIYFQGGDEVMADQGILEDLTSYIEGSEVIQNAMLPYQKERLSNYPYLLWIKPIANKVPVIRTDFFNEMETTEALMADPTVDNYYAFFEEVKEKYTDFAITAPGKLLEIDTIFNNAFGVTGTWVNIDGDYVFGKVTDMEKQKLAFYAKLYAEGLLDSEYLTKAWDTKEQAFYANKVGVISGTSGKVIDIYDGNMKKENGDAAELTVLPPAKGVAQGYNPISVTKETRGIAISSVSEHKDIAWKVIEFLASNEGQYIDRLGVEGKHFNIVNNKIELTEAAQNWFAFFFEVPSWQPEMEMATPLLGEPALNSLKMAEKYYVSDVDVSIPVEYAPQLDAISNLYNEFAADFVTGKKSNDEWDEFVADWYAQGGKEITDYVNSELK